MFVLAGLVALHRQRPAWAALGFAGASLYRETALLIPASLALTRLLALVRRRARPGMVDLAWAVPLVAWAGWQAVCAVRYGRPPLLSPGGIVGIPLVAVVTASARWVTHPSVVSTLQLLHLATFVVMVVMALGVLRTSRAPPAERLGSLVAILVMLSLSGRVWTDDPAVFRIMVDAWVLGRHRPARIAICLGRRTRDTQHPPVGRERTATDQVPVTGQHRGSCWPIPLGHGSSSPTET